MINFIITLSVILACMLAAQIIFILITWLVIRIKNIIVNSFYSLCNLIYQKSADQMKTDWIKQIPDFELILTQPERDMIEEIGLENFIKLLNRFGKTSFYFSERSITDLRRKWAVLYKNVPYDEAARTLGVSSSSIYNWRNGDGGNTDNLELFEKEK